MTAGFDPAEALDFASRLAVEAGGIISAHLGQVLEVRHKGTVDLVTDADLASEKAILAAITEHYPGHHIISEESRDNVATHGAIGTPYRWVVDPLDGTTNFVHGLHLFAVSIALQIKARTEIGVVYNPALDELYAARSGAGATLNGEPIHVSATDDLQEALFVTGFPYSRDEVFHRSFDLWHEFYTRCQGGRRLGAAALDCCYVAAGRFDFFYEAALKPWDICAGDLICREAGGQTSDWSDEPLPFDASRVLMSNGKLHGAALEVLGGSGFPGS